MLIILTRTNGKEQAISNDIKTLSMRDKYDCNNHEHLSRNTYTIEKIQNEVIATLTFAEISELSVNISTTSAT